MQVAAPFPVAHEWRPREFEPCDLFYTWRRSLPMNGGELISSSRLTQPDVEHFAIFCGRELTCFIYWTRG